MMLIFTLDIKDYLMALSSEDSWIQVDPESRDSLSLVGREMRHPFQSDYGPESKIIPRTGEPMRLGRKS